MGAGSQSFKEITKIYVKRPNYGLHMSCIYKHRNIDKVIASHVRKICFQMARLYY